MWLSKALLKNNVKVHALGLQSYSSVLATMKSIVEKKMLKKEGIAANQSVAEDRAEDSRDRILICQHRPVYTVGIRTRDYMDESEMVRLKGLGAEFVYTDRGGLITFHGPGQLVCYPILNLKHYDLSLRCYIHKLEEVIMQTCQKFGVATHRTDDVGIWIGNNKIAAIGVHCKRHVTSHGLALNCNTDLSWFSHIVPCGLEGKSVTSLTREVVCGNVEEEHTVGMVTPHLLDSFADVFGCDIEFASVAEVCE